MPYIRCDGCGKHVDAQTICCPVCGRKLQESEVDRRNNRCKGIIISICMLISMYIIILLVLLIVQSLSRGKIKDLVMDSGQYGIVVDRETQFFTPTQVEVLSREKKGNNSYLVICRLYMSSAYGDARARYGFTFRQADGKWYIADTYLVAVEEVDVAR